MERNVEQSQPQSGVISSQTELKLGRDWAEIGQKLARNRSHKRPLLRVLVAPVVATGNLLRGTSSKGGAKRNCGEANFHGKKTAAFLGPFSVEKSGNFNMNLQSSYSSSSSSSSSRSDCSDIDRSPDNRRTIESNWSESEVKWVKIEGNTGKYRV